MTENEIAGVLKEYLEATLEPRIREGVKSGDIASQREFDACLTTVMLRQLIEQWESDLKEKLSYSDMPETPGVTKRALEQEWAEQEDRIAHMTPEERGQKLAEFQDEHPEYTGLSLTDIFRKIREETCDQASAPSNVS
jgi:hypothetical protein